MSNNINNNLIAPLGFCHVHDNVYRSSYPATKSLSFISTLGLKSMVCLTPSDIKKDLREYCEKVQTITTNSNTITITKFITIMIITIMIRIILVYMKLMLVIIKNHL